MARIPRLMVAGEPTVYHVISRTALDGFGREMKWGQVLIYQESR